ncbi:MAG: tyrosine-type recombinase/integrase [Hyphomonadaceae bacterium]|nr:tyrosine-type recombinase/integrase [Hyphomonadaceae bacterium]
MTAYYEADSKFSKPKAKGEPTVSPGSFDSLILSYYRSPLFISLSPASQKNYKRLLDRWRGKHGSKPVRDLQRKHVMEHLAERYEQAGPEGANGLRKVLKIICRFALDGGWRGDDPTFKVKKYKPPGEGFAPWSDEDIATFLQHWESGTRERLALCLLYYLGQRRGDVVRLGRQHRTRDAIRFKQSKTGTELTIPIHPDLKAVLDELPNDNLTFLTTAYGKPFSAAGFGNWFRGACDKAGLSKRSAHGLRKAAARRLAEAGCSSKEIAAITGHKTLSEVERYTASADQERMAREAISKMIVGRK